jgi:GNAT superfamily N-acetyltransferase
MCELLPWDSALFGVKIARVNAPTLTVNDCEHILDWCEQEHVDCLYYLAPLDDAAAVRVAEAHQFALVDVRMELARPATPALGIESVGIRSACASDLPALQDIAASSHTATRFYFDPGFGRDACDELYRTWITRSCRGYADKVLVALKDSGPAGYVTLHLDPSHHGRIGLIAVAATARGTGLGMGLIQGALCWFSQQSVGVVSTATQARNTAALHLFVRAGFTVSNVGLWYHRWFGRSAGR